MQNRFNANNIENSIQKLMAVIGAQAVRFIQPLVKVDTGNLRASISWAVRENAGGNSGSTTPITKPSQAGIVRIGSNVVYAAIQEFGGTITPTKAGALTVPIHPSAKGKLAGEFNDLILIKRPGKNSLLVRNVLTKGGKFKRMDIMYVLVQQVQIKKQSYFRRGIYGNINALNDTMKKGLANIMRRGGLN